MNTGNLIWIHKLVKIKNLLLVSDTVFIFSVSYFFEDSPCIMSMAGILFLLLFTVIFLMNFIESQKSEFEKQIWQFITSFGIILIPIFFAIQLLKFFESCL